jgi:altronate dehydratase
MLESDHQAGNGSDEETMARAAPAVLVLKGADNVGVACRPIAAGETVTAAGAELSARSPVPRAHKIALRPIAAGEKVIRSGVPIGSATATIAAGRGSVLGSAIAPTVKICANPDTWRRMAGDMDVDAGRILEGEASLDEVGAEVVDAVLATAAGRRTKSEALGHQEFVLGYKAYEPAGPACLPAA